MHGAPGKFDVAVEASSVAKPNRIPNENDSTIGEPTLALNSACPYVRAGHVERRTVLEATPAAPGLSREIRWSSRAKPRVVTRPAGVTAPARGAVRGARCR